MDTGDDTTSIASEPTDLPDGSSYNTDTASTVSESNPAENAEQAADSWLTPVTNRSCQKRKRRTTDDNSSPIEKSLAAMHQYFTARASAIKAQITTVHHSENEDDDALFSKMIAAELKNITTPSIKRTLKKFIIDAVYDAQAKEAEAKEKTALQQVQQVQYYLMPDGTVQFVQASGSQQLPTTSTTSSDSLE